MVTYRPEDGTWEVGAGASGIAEIKSKLSPDRYESVKKDLQEFLCSYFSFGDCTHKLGKSIAPIGATRGGGKIFKVRWALPGDGKRGGLRLCVVVYCERKRVVIAEAFQRKISASDQAYWDSATIVDPPEPE